MEKVKFGNDDKNHCFTLKKVFFNLWSDHAG